MKLIKFAACLLAAPAALAAQPAPAPAVDIGPVLVLNMGQAGR